MLFLFLHKGCVMFRFLKEWLGFGNTIEESTYNLDDAQIGGI